MKRSHDSCQSPLLLSDINVPEKPKKKSCEVTTADFQSWSEQWGLCRSVKVNCQTSWNCRVTWRQLACFTSIVQPSVGSRCNTVLSPRLMDHLFRHSTENTHTCIRLSNTLLLLVYVRQSEVFSGCYSSVDITEMNSSVQLCERCW